MDAVISERTLTNSNKAQTLVYLVWLRSNSFWSHGHDNNLKATAQGNELFGGAKREEAEKPEEIKYSL